MKKYQIKVGISLRVENIEKYNEKRDAISQDWIKFCNRAGFMPILIPNNLTDIKGFLKSMNLDMLIFSGGDNIGDDLERDKTEKNMMEFAIKNKKHIFCEKPFTISSKEANYLTNLIKNKKLWMNFLLNTNSV